MVFNKQKKQGLFMGLCFIMTASFASAQDANRHISLKEAFSLALQSSKSLKADNAKVKDAIANYENVKNNQLPDISASGSYLRVNKPTINLKYLDGQSAGSGSGESTTSVPDVNQAMYGMVSASYPIFAGGTIKNGIKSAEYLQNATKYDVERDKDLIAQNVVNAYYNLYKSQAAIKLVKENLATAKQRVIDFQHLEENSLIARNDLLKVQLQESNVELTLINAEKQEKITNYNFGLLLGIEPTTQLELDSIDINSMPTLNNMDSLENFALTNRGDVKAITERLNASLTAIDIAKGHRLPTVALSAGYIAMDVPHALSITNAVNAGVGVKYDIGSLYKSKAKIKQAQAQAENLQWTKADLQDGIRSELYTDIQNFERTLKSLDVYKLAITQANENYRVTKNKYDNSLATTTDLLDADVAKLQANIDYEYSKADAMIAYNKIFEAAGNILKINQITETPNTNN